MIVGIVTREKRKWRNVKIYGKGNQKDLEHKKCNSCTCGCESVSITKKLDERFRKKKRYHTEKTTLLGTSRIMRKVLDY